MIDTKKQDVNGKNDPDKGATMHAGKKTPYSYQAVDNFGFMKQNAASVQESKMRGSG